MCMSSPSISGAPAPTPQIQQQDNAVLAASDAERRRQAMASGRASTLLTGGMGVTSPATTQSKTLLGS